MTFGFQTTHGQVKKDSRGFESTKPNDRKAARRCGFLEGGQRERTIQQV
jgi:hypothetical protein